MPRSLLKVRKEVPSFTEDPEWQDIQSDRLLGFEILRNAVRGYVAEMPPGELAEKIGQDKGFVFQVTQAISRRLS